MLDTFEQDTKWYTIVNSKELIKKIDSNNEIEKLKNYSNMVKRALESASYKSGYESIKEETKEKERYYPYFPLADTRTSARTLGTIRTA